MRKSFPYALALTTALFMATALLADTFYIPIPETRGGNIIAQVEFHGAKSGFANGLFIPENTPSSGLFGTTQKVDNFFRPNVWDITNNLTSGGLFVINADAPLTFTAASFLVNSGSQNTAWQLPVITAGNWFAPGATAFLDRLGRDQAGNGITGLQTVNFSNKLANCSAQIQRPKGSPVGDPVRFSVSAVSSVNIPDFLAAGGYATVAPVLRATVTCDQPFYAYATFGTPSRLFVRVSFPLDAPSLPPGPAVSMNIPGTFFVPRSGNSDLVLNLPLVPNTSYRAVTIDYDLQIKQFDFVFNVLLGMFHHGGPRFNKTLYFGTFIRGLRNRYVMDLGSPSLEVDLKENYGFVEGGSYHFHIVYDGEHEQISNLVFDPHGNLVLDVEGGTFNNDIADRGNPVVIDWGVGGIADGAYFPPLGWRFSNLHVVASQ
jgi:hypothetical protein